jgi:hypothetical protein
MSIWRTEMSVAINDRNNQFPWGAQASINVCGL